MIELRELLRNEVAAARAYRRGFDHLARDTVRALTPLHREHRLTAALLRNALAQRNARGSLDTTGRWRMLGPNRGILEGLYGPRAVVERLRAAEADGVSHVRRAAKAASTRGLRPLLSARVLPRLCNNLVVLDQLLHHLLERDRTGLEALSPARTRHHA